MAKFKEGSVVKVLRDNVVISRGTVGTVIDYHGKNMVNVDFGREIGVKRLSEELLDFANTPTPTPITPVTYGLRKFIEEYVADKASPLTIPPVKDAFTDPNVDYEALSEEPVYYEFIDIGKALNKLKKYEHLGCKTPDSEEEELIYIINLRSHTVVTPCLVLKKEYNGRDLIKYTVKNPLDSQLDIYPIDKNISIFTKFKEALAHLELLNKIDKSEEIPF